MSFGTFRDMGAQRVKIWADGNQLRPARKKGSECCPSMTLQKRSDLLEIAAEALNARAGFLEGFR